MPFPREGGGPGIKQDGVRGSWAPAFAGELEAGASTEVKPHPTAASEATFATFRP